MAIRLKNDWKAHGNNPTARRVADWMNTISDLFNFAHVPSGGMAQPTERGFQIEVADGGDGDQLDHAFLPTQTDENEATLTPGYVTSRDGVRRNITDVGTNWLGGVVDFESVNDKCWWVRINYSSAPGPNLGDFLSLEWVKGAAFPGHRDPNGYTINIPVIEFPNNTWDSMIRRQTNDIVDVPHYADDITDSNEPWPTPPPYDTIPDRPDPPVSGDFKHSELKDIVEFTAVTDDHSGANFRYLANTGDELRNDMTGVIGDASKSVSYDPNARTIHRSTGPISIDGENSIINDGNGNMAIDVGDSAADPPNRAYYAMDALNVNPVLSIEMQDRQAYGDDAGVAVLALDWALRQLAGGDWTVTLGDLDLTGADKVYKHQGAPGVTGDGFSGGIKTDEAGADDATVALIEMYT